MLTKEQFLNLHNNDKDALNTMFGSSTPAEQDQYIIWLDEINPIEEMTSEEAGQATVRTALDEMEAAIPDTTTLEQSIHAEYIAREEGRIVSKRQTPMQVAARQRAYRSNLLRRLKRQFRVMELFTTKQAHEVTGIDIEALARYLANESNLEGSQIGYNPEIKKYYVVDPLL